MKKRSPDNTKLQLIKLCLDPFSRTEHHIPTLLNFLPLPNLVTTFKMPFSAISGPYQPHPCSNTT